ncbi:hypothetical protein IMSAGC004_01690 [Bacteroidaceae bacterium]|nr:hypothetical protein IMSAGC004_01690 [Bacteroidaceae bacterium]
MRFLHAVHAAGASPADEHLAEEAAPFLVFEAVDGEDFLAVHVRKPENGLDFIEPLAELALVEQHHHVRVVDDGLLDDRTADDVLYLLRHHAHRSPKLTGRLVHELDVLGHERAGNGFPCLLDDQDLAVLLDTHLLQEHVHDNQRNKREQERIIFYTVDFKDNERFVKQRAVHVFVQRLIMVAATVKVFHHVAVCRNVNTRNTVFVADVWNTLHGKLVERVERQLFHF